MFPSIQPTLLARSPSCPGRPGRAWPSRRRAQAAITPPASRESSVVLLCEGSSPLALFALCLSDLFALSPLNLDLARSFHRLRHPRLAALFRLFQEDLYRHPLFGDIPVWLLLFGFLKKISIGIRSVVAFALPCLAFGWMELWDSKERDGGVVCVRSPMATARSLLVGLR